MRGGILAGLCVLNLVAPGLAHAEDRATTDDVRCLVVSLVIAGSGQQGAQAEGMARRSTTSAASTGVRPISTWKTG